MSCNECQTGKTLYDKTVVRRAAATSRRARRTMASGLVLSLLALGGAATLAPAHAADFSGFSTHAQATPLRIELREPAIPIPADPQAEFNFSYTKVDGTSGPIGTARASAMWPGDSVGEGLKTFGEQLGLPAPLLVLTNGGYPVQVNAQSPGDTTSQTQEFFAGMTGKVNTSGKQAVAKVGYGTSGDVDPGDNGTTTAPSSPSLLDSLKNGDLSALGNALTGTKSGGANDPQPSAGPLGNLSLLVNAGGMDSISTTNYDPDADKVTATATSRLGNISLLAGIVQLTGVEVITTVTSNIAEGAKIYKKVNVGGMSIAGNKFVFTGTGIEAQGKQTPIPGLPDAPAAALKALGISFHLGEVTQDKSGSSGTITAEGLRITIDTAPLRSKLPSLPLGDLINKLPDLPGQASILKGLLLALTEAHPRLDLVLGQSTASAQTVPAIDNGSVTPPDLGGVVTPPSTGDTPITAPLPGENAPLPTGEQQNNPNIKYTNAPGLPPLGSIPMWLLLLGLAAALGVGWYVRTAGLLLFGAAGACGHGLKSGIPDLRKA
ncbi:hypothetical protein [Nocardioides marmorisolisilvae]|uniref:Uncharacterized protein n=1 Tax=Nocardioides marmorisolisilvae TaxID=1542737 RepID=A0A3N0DWV5_9ACTN|nr:hypothetical protein [Nocardioides marmorisolisilvae]RNL80104.1 hypothetical protein EFL95_14435 [Nocardioides marmorisolisilvae]